MLKSGRFLSLSLCQSCCSVYLVASHLEVNAVFAFNTSELYSAYTYTRTCCTICSTVYDLRVLVKCVVHKSAFLSDDHYSCCEQQMHVCVSVCGHVHVHGHL